MNTNDYLEFCLKIVIYEQNKLIDTYKYSNEPDYIAWCEKRLDSLQKCKWSIQKAIDIYCGVLEND